MTTAFPPSALFSWTPSTGPAASNDLGDVTRRLQALSLEPPRRWEVSIAMKVQKAKGKEDDSSLPTLPPLAAAEKVNIPPLFFFRFSDCETVCAIPANNENEYKIEDVVAGEEHLESMLTEYSKLVRRSNWKIYGQSFLFKDFVVSIGKLEQGSVSNAIILEVSYIGDQTENRAVVYEIIYDFSESIFPLSVNRDSVNAHIYHDTPSRKYENSHSPQPLFSIAARGLQWMLCLKHITN